MHCIRKPFSEQRACSQAHDLALLVPKGPFRTKTTTMIAKIVNYYAVLLLLRPPDLLRRGPFSEREGVCNSQENGVRTRRAAIVNHRAIVNILRVVNLLCVVFLVQRGCLGKGAARCTSGGRTLRGSILGIFWKSPSKNTFQEPLLKRANPSLRTLPAC